MRRRTLVLALSIILGLSALEAQQLNLLPSHRKNVGPVKGRAPTVRLAAFASLFTPQELEQGVYVGDEYCIACHQSAKSTRETRHRGSVRKPMGALSLIPERGVVADYDNNGIDDFIQGLDFNEISSKFDDFKPHAPILGYEADTDTYTITIGDMTYPVVMTIGGSGDWAQAYLVRLPVDYTDSRLSTGVYLAPLRYYEKSRSYTWARPGDWWTGLFENVQPKWTAPLGSGEISIFISSAATYCIGCHTTGDRHKLDMDRHMEFVYTPYPATLVNPERPEQYPDYDNDGLPDLLSVGCEACHGPGSKHLLAGGGTTGILNPAKLDTEQANEICEQCHVRVWSTPSQSVPWPYRTDARERWIPGVTEAPLKDYYASNAVTWDDEKTALLRYQHYFDFYNSSKPHNTGDPIICADCHDPHKGPDRMIRSTIDVHGVQVPTRADDNTLCLACHAERGHFAEITVQQLAELNQNADHIAEIVEQHSHHPYAPTRDMGLSRCTKCHMPEVAIQTEAFDLHSHTFEPLPPEKTLLYHKGDLYWVDQSNGMPNACAASCHSMKVNSFGLGLDPRLRHWHDEFDKLTAERLLEYYGPGGLWWDTSDPASMMLEIIEDAPPPGRISSRSSDSASE